VVVGADAHVEKAIIASRARIGAGARIGHGAVIGHDAVIAPGAEIAANARVAVWVIPTDEERMIARHTRELLGLG